MIRGLIFNLGYTLLDFKAQADMQPVQRHMSADLVDYLRQDANIDIAPDVFTNVFHDQLATIDRQRRKDVMENALEAYSKYSETLWESMPHLHTVLKEIEQTGHRMALISNAGDEVNVQRQVNEHGPQSYFDPIIVSEAAGVRKPHPRIFQPVLDHWPITISEIVIIGDTLGADVLGAINTGIRSIWVRTQPDPSDNLALATRLHPDATAETLLDIPGVLRTLDNTP